jgi:hypothetical protein
MDLSAIIFTILSSIIIVMVAVMIGIAVCFWGSLALYGLFSLTKLTIPKRRDRVGFEVILRDPKP